MTLPEITTLIRWGFVNDPLAPLAIALGMIFFAMLWIVTP